MKILILAPSYPHPGHLFAGIFNQRSAVALSRLCESVQVIAPRPYAPILLSSFVARWKAYSRIPSYEFKDGVSVYRPGYLQVPRLGGAIWTDPGAFLFARQLAKRMHRRTGFDAILSFDLVGTGGLAWRLGEKLGIPSAGWATGNDIRVAPSSSHGRVLLRAVEHLGLIFYQSYELLTIGARLLGIPVSRMDKSRHVVLPRGIMDPPSLNRDEVRNRIRAELGIKGDQILVLYVGRILKEKGVFELLEAVRTAASRDRRIICVMVGCQTAFDATTEVQKTLEDTLGLEERVKLLSACEPDRVWEYLCAADIFVFPSHNEGMPNSLLEAMVMGIPAIAFAIPAVLEIEAGSGGVVVVPRLSASLLSEAIVRLAASPYQRIQIGLKGKQLVEDRFMLRKNVMTVLTRLTSLVERRACHHPAQTTHGTMFLPDSDQMLE